MTDLRPPYSRPIGIDEAPQDPAQEHALEEMHAGASAPRPRSTQGRPPGRGGRRRRRLRPTVVARSAPAGHALLVIVGALLFAILFNSHGMVRTGEGMSKGTTRTLVLGVAKPIDTFAHAVYLDRPRRWLDSVFGHSQAPTGPSELSKLPPAADDRPVGSGGAKSPAAAPSSPTKGGMPTPPNTPERPAVPALRVPTKTEPLKLLVAGDSMTEFFGPALVNQGSAGGKLNGSTITKYGTGLVRPDFFDWSIYAKELMDQQDPEAVVVLMGGNDGQGITLANGQVLRDGTEEWAKEYRRRVEVVMRTFSGGGKRKVYWVPMPIPRSQQLATDFHLMDLAVADAAATVPGVTDVNIVNRLSNNGQYSDYLRDRNGQTILARARDGIHLSQDGANLAASLVLQALNKDWHLSP